MFHGIKHPFVYFVPTKTGSGTITAILRKNRIEYKMDETGDHGIQPPAKLAEYADTFCFISVRNPYARMVSAWSYFKHTTRRHKPKGHLRRVASELSHGTTFSQWLDRCIIRDDRFERFKRYWGPQADYLSVMPRCDLIIRQESLMVDVAKLPFLPKKPNLTNPRTHVGPYRKHYASWQEVYDNDKGLKAVVQQRFAADFELLDYPTDFEVQ